MNNIRKVVKIFIASPSDIVKERDFFREIIDETNKIKANTLGIHLEAVGWEETDLGLGRPQEKINKDLIECELVVIILWMRWGQPTGMYSSGIEEEFAVAKKRYEDTKKPEIQLFFRDIPDDRRLNPDDQLSRVLKFKAEIESAKELLFSRYENPEGWKKQFRIQLNKWFDQQPFGISEKLKEIEEYKEKTERLELLQTTIQSKSDRVALDLIIDAREKAKLGQITKAEKGFIDANTLSQNPAVINGYGLFLIEIGLLEKSKIQFNKLLEIGTSKKDNLITAIAYGNLGISHQLSENFEDALTCFNKAIEFNKKIGRMEGVAGQLANIGINFRMQKKFDEAKPYFIEAHDSFLKIGNTKKIATSFSNLGLLYYDLKEIEKAQKCCKKSLQYYDGQEFDKAIGYLCFNIGIYLTQLNRFDDAKDFFNSAERIFSSLNLLQIVADIYGTLGNYFFEKGMIIVAIDYYNDALEYYEQLGAEEKIALSYCNLGVANIQLQRYDEAKEKLEKSLGIYQKLNHIDGMALVYKNLGWLYEQINDYDNVEKMYEACANCYKK